MKRPTIKDLAEDIRRRWPDLAVREEVMPWLKSTQRAFRDPAGITHWTQVLEFSHALTLNYSRHYCCDTSRVIGEVYDKLEDVDRYTFAGNPDNGPVTCFACLTGESRETDVGIAVVNPKAISKLSFD